ncbi:putative endonuclease [Microlunatus panaciterrae]|uniref:UPF0102 protein JOE57_003304 n=1 Tax=Microlunatus panaciterrae TaxID=400768 RepID=A0ABS2RMZ4_9ACTN|nr:putative endonuclease [Microlunatus panaciterrae]
MPSSKRDVGVRGEDLAADYLRAEAGMQILARNWRCRLGELDIVALENDGDRRTLVFCEVKCRSGLGFGSPLEAITGQKLRRLRQLAAHWLVAEGTHADDIRLDAVGVVLSPGAEPVITHVRAIG